MSPCVEITLDSKYLKRPAPRIAIAVAVILLVAPGCDDASDKFELEPLEGVVVEPATWNFGSTKLFQLEKDIVVWNRTDRDVAIVDVETTCRCTTTGLQLPMIVTPGDKLVVPVTVKLPPRDSPGGGFGQALSLSIESSGGVRKHRVTIEGKVIRENHLRAVPGYVDFGRFGSWERPSRVIQLDVGEGALEVERIETRSDNLDALLTDHRTLTLSVSGKNVGKLSGAVRVATSRGTINVGYRGEGLGSGFSKQPVTFVRQEVAGGSASGVLLVRHDPSLKLNSLEIVSDIGEVEVERTNEIADDEADVYFSVRGIASAESLRGSLIVKWAGGETFETDCICLLSKNK